MKTLIIIAFILGFIIGWFIGFFYNAIFYWGVSNEILNYVSDRLWFVSVCL